VSAPIASWSLTIVSVDRQKMSAAARSGGQGRPSGRRGTRLVLDRGEHGRRLLLGRTGWRSTARRCAILAAALSMFVVAMSSSSPALGEDRRVSPARTPTALDPAIAEASLRSGLPQAWIRAVVRAESNGNPRAISSKGAMGLMQLMPGAWREVRDEMGLGPDPFDIRDNVLAGAAYLRRMHDRFGETGFLAAYNAGPGRYAEHLRTGRRLPLETRAYVARLRPLLGSNPAVPQASTHRQPSDWRASALFVDTAAAPHHPSAAIIEGDL
jgi:hypothetical protein